MSFRVKTKVQQRALAGERYRGIVETLTRLIRGESSLLSVLGMLIPVLFMHQVLTRKTQSRY